MGLEYVDIFYHHRPDPRTPLEETMGALDLMVRQGKTLYVGLSNYDSAETERAVDILEALGTPCLLHQPSYSMLQRWVEEGLLDVLQARGVGCIPFSTLAQGLLAGRYLDGIPADSRVAKPHGFLSGDQLTEATLGRVRALNEIARRRGQSLAQMALAWVLMDSRITSVLVGVSREEQLLDCLGSLDAPAFSDDELEEIEGVLT
jgi:L-glyceraldehyde 3-phosphate reductase